MTAHWFQEPIHEAYAANRLRLVAFARRAAASHRLSDAEVDAEGVVQDAYLKALTRWSEINEPLPWLYAVIANRVSEIRRKSVSTDELVDGAPWRWASSARVAGPDVAAEFQLVLAALGELPEAEAAVLYLSRVQGWTHEEIARHRGISQGLSRVILHRATQRVQKRWSALRGTRRADGWEPVVSPAAWWVGGAVAAVVLAALLWFAWWGG